MSWEKVALGKVCSIVNGGTPKSGITEYWDGNLNWITPKEMGKLESRNISNTERKITDKGLKNSSAKLLPINSVILSSRAPIGHLAINTEPMATNQGCKGLIPSDKLYYEYLYYFLRHSKQLLNDMGSGATFKELSGSKLATVEIPLPSFSIQKAVVKKLDAIFEEINEASLATEANINNSEALFQSYLTEIFETNAENWETKNLIQLANEDCTLSYGIVQPGDDYENGLPIVRPTNLTQKYISKFELKTINPVLADSYKRTTLTGNELLLCVRGTTGTVAISTEELKGCNVTRGIVPIRFKANEVNLDYAYYLFNSSVIQKQIKSKTYGAALLQINIADIKKLQVKVPPLDEQMTLVHKLNSLQEVIANLKKLQSTKLENLLHFKKSILQQAFNGELIRE